jgi:hypothetical protein
MVDMMGRQLEAIRDARESGGDMFHAIETQANEVMDAFLTRGSPRCWPWPDTRR